VAAALEAARAEAAAAVPAAAAVAVAEVPVAAPGAEAAAEAAVAAAVAVAPEAARRRRHRTVLLHLSRRRIVRIRHRSWVTAFALVFIVALRDTSRNRHGDEGQYYQWDAHPGLLTKVCGSLKQHRQQGQEAHPQPALDV